MVTSEGTGDFYEGNFNGSFGRRCFRLLKLKNVGAARASLARLYLMRGQTVDPVNCELLLLWVQRIESGLAR